MSTTGIPSATSSTSTAGIELHTRRRWLADTVELLSSMRFAISLLTLIALASVIGTVLKQGEPMPNYVNQFGPFWFDVFQRLGLYSVYSTWWFLLIMAFLVTSTSLCLIRNAPKMLADMRSWRDNVREQSLRNFHHKAEWQSALTVPAATQQLADRIAARGYKVKVVDKDNATLLTAKKGAANKWGYIFAHSAIVIICVGGLLDSDMPVRFQERFFGKVPFSGNGLVAQIPEQHRLSVDNPTYRANMLVPEGGAASVALLQRPDGVLIQELPFTIQLKRFVVDFYSTGMPKLFASDVILRENATGKSFPATIKVNEPLIHNGIAIYQSSFEDGGSKLELTGFPMHGTATSPVPVAGEVGTDAPLLGAKDEYKIEWTGFRPFNVENIGAPGDDLRAVKKDKGLEQNFATGLDKRLGSAAKNANRKDLKNVGPSVQYKLRDRNGQAREFSNYMQPIEVDGQSVFLTGMRESPSEPFRYLRIPADDNESVKEWMRLRAALQDPAQRQDAARRYARRAIPDNRADAGKLQRQLEESAQKGLEIFAGVDANGKAGDPKQAGYLGVSSFISRIPAADQEKAADIFMKILTGSLWDLWQAARAHDNLPPIEATEKHARFLQVATNALSDAFFYTAPLYLQLDSFKEVKASVFQVTRSPGKKVVYLGCLFLVLGVFAMLYVRERRLWVWLRPTGEGHTHALMAMSSQRKTLDFDREFEQLKTQLPQSAA